MIEIGAKAPAFKLPATGNKNIALKDFAGKTVVLFFYPKDMTPGCTQEACDFRDHHAAYLKRKAVVLGISRDSVSQHEKFKEKYELPYPLLSDEDGTICEAYGVWKEKNLYGKKSMGIERTTFVIDGTGKIQQIYRKVKVADHVPAVLEGIG